MILNIADDFSMTPGVRYRKQGEFSGEEFRDEILIPRLNEVIDNDEKLVIDLDGVFGYPTTFIEEAFGGLIRKGYTFNEFNNYVVLKTEEFEYLINDIKKYMIDAEMEKNHKFPMIENFINDKIRRRNKYEENIRRQKIKHS